VSVFGNESGELSGRGRLGLDDRFVIHYTGNGSSSSARLASRLNNARIEQTQCRESCLHERSEAD
jgi:hypothetical protein